jgi:hypothetical protein
VRRRVALLQERESQWASLDEYTVVWCPRTVAFLSFPFLSRYSIASSRSVVPHTSPFQAISGIDIYSSPPPSSKPRVSDQTNQLLICNMQQKEDLFLNLHQASKLGTCRTSSVSYASNTTRQSIGASIRKGDPATNLEVVVLCVCSM